MKRLSVIIPAHNAGATLAACVRSVLASDQPANEIIIVDDASGDETRAIVDELAKQHPKVRYVRLSSNQGPAFARNTGAEAASGDYYFFLDADTELDAGALQKFTSRIGEADAVCGIYDPKPLNCGIVPRYKALFDHFNFSRRGVVSYDGFSAYCAGVRAEAFRRIGGFDEQIGPGMDYELEELGYRLSRDHHTLLDPAIRARHHFPKFWKLTRTYFRRVRQWTRLSLMRGKLESAGDATLASGLFTACALGAVATLPLALLGPPAVVPGTFALLWFVGHTPFFLFVARDDLARLLPAVALNGYFSLVIASGAAAGALDLLRSTLEKASGQSSRYSGI